MTLSNLSQYGAAFQIKVLSSLLTHKEFLLNIHDVSVKKLFYGWYLKQKFLDNENYKHLPQFKDPLYDPYFDICEVKDLLIVISAFTVKRERSEKLFYFFNYFFRTHCICSC